MPQPMPAAPQTQAPAPAGGGAPGQPPFGSSPATQPTQNKGYEAAGLAKLALVVRQLEHVIPLLGVQTEPGKAALESLNKLAKHVSAGSVSPQTEKNQIEEMARKQAQTGPMIQQIRQAAMGAGAQGGAPPGAAAAA